MEENQQSLSKLSSKNIFQTFVGKQAEEPQKYTRQVISLEKRKIVLVPRKNAELRLSEYGILPNRKYTLDVVLEIGKRFQQGYSPKIIANQLCAEYPSLRESRLSREFVKTAIKLLELAILPEMVNYVPRDGNWTLIIDGTVRAKDDNVLVIIAAHRLDGLQPSIIPLSAQFLPSENTQDVVQLLLELKHRLPSQPRSIMSDFRVGLLEAAGEVFPDAIQQGCHYHFLELCSRILIQPLIGKIRKKMNKTVSALNRWAHHSIYGRKSDKLVLLARSLQRLCQSKTGKFGANFLQFCRKFEALSQWIQEKQAYLKSDKKYRELVKILDTKLWRQLAPQLSQLRFVLKEFSQLRSLLTAQEYKTEVVLHDNAAVGSEIPLLQLMADWHQLGVIREKELFHKRFKEAAETLERHFSLLTPAMLDPGLPRTTSLLENLYARIKMFLRKWSGSMKLRRSFQWAASLAAVCQSLSETPIFEEILQDQTSYDWVEKSRYLSKITQRDQLEIRFARITAAKTPEGLVSTAATLIRLDLEG